MNSIICKIIGHNYTKVNKSIIDTHEYECKNCKEKFTTDGYGTIVKLTPFWQENNLLFEQYRRESSTQI